MGIDTIIAISLSAVLWSGGTWLIQFWSRGRIHSDPTLMHLLLIAVVLEGFLQSLASTGWATNRLRSVSVGQLASAVISLVLAVAFLGRFGPSAIPLAAIIPLVAIMTPLSLQNARSETHLTCRFLVWHLLLPFTLLAAFSAVFPAFIASVGIAPTWLCGLISSMGTCALAIFIASAVFLTGDDRKAVYERLVLRSSRNANREIALSESLTRLDR
jgi:hypothetical protein